MPYKELGTEQEITGTTPKEKAASRKALGFPDGVAVEKTQLMFNNELSYIIGTPDSDPTKSDLLYPNFSIDRVIKSILTEVSPDKTTLQESGLKKSYLVPSANAFWLGAFNLPEHSENLKQELTKAKALKSPEKEENDSIVFLVCTKPNNQYEYCELLPDRTKPGEWRLITSNTAGDEWNTHNYKDETDPLKKPNEHTEQIKSLLESQGFTLSNIASKCDFKGSIPSGSGVAAVETVIDRLFLNPIAIEYSLDCVNMSENIDNDIEGEPKISLEERTRLRHATIVIKAASRDTTLLDGLKQQLKAVSVDNDNNNPLPVYLAGLDEHGVVAAKLPVPADQMASYYQAYIKELKLIQLENKDAANPNRPPAVEFRTQDLTWNMRAYNEHTKNKLTITLIKKLGAEVTIDALKEDKITTAKSSSDTASYSIKVNEKTLTEISKNGVSVPRNWIETRQTFENAAYVAITTFMSVSSSKKIIMTGADPQLCKAIKDMIKDNVKYSEFKDLVIIDNVSKAVAAPTPPTTARGFKPMKPAVPDPSATPTPSAPSL